MHVQKDSWQQGGYEKILIYTDKPVTVHQTELLDDTGVTISINQIDYRPAVKYEQVSSQCFRVWFLSDTEASVWYGFHYFDPAIVSGPDYGINTIAGTIDDNPP